MAKEGRCYDIDSTFDKYSDSPQAIAYLQAVLDRSCPSDFHWTHVDVARRLAKEDREGEVGHG